MIYSKQMLEINLLFFLLLWICLFVIITYIIIAIMPTPAINSASVFEPTLFNTAIIMLATHQKQLLF